MHQDAIGESVAAPPPPLPPRAELPDYWPPPAPPQAEPVEHAFQFDGNAREYFRIWIVNLALSIVTLGIYGLYWQYAMFKEMKEHSGNGLGGGLGLLLTFITGGLVGLLLIPNEIGSLYTAKGQEAPVSWMTAFWVLIPLVGGIIYLVKVQDRMNDYWGSIPPLTEGFAAPAV